MVGFAFVPSQGVVIPCELSNNDMMMKEKTRGVSHCNFETGNMISVAVP